MDTVPHDRLGSLEAQIDEQTLDGLIGGRSGISDVACPLCGPHARAPSNQRRRVLRVWNNEGFLTYKCARCGASGCATGDKPRPATPLAPVDNTARKALAERLWGMGQVVCFSPVEHYLRLRRVYAAHAPPPWGSMGSIRYLPPQEGYPPTMIAKFRGTSAVHLTRLKADGSGKAGTDHDKLMIGPVSGFPIVIQSGLWGRPLLICEGIEDGLSLALAFPDWNIWAAGSAGHIHKLVPVDRESIVAVDDDKAGQGAAERSLSINPQTKVIKFQKGLDANAILVKHGLNALREFVTRHQPFHR